MVNKQEILDWFSEELKIRLKEENMTPHQLAEKIGMSYDHVSNIFYGRCFPNPYYMVLIADQLDCTVNELLGYEDLGEIWRCERFRVTSVYTNKYKYAKCVADRLELYRYDSGMTVERMCEKIGCSLKVYRQWTGTYNSDDPVLPKLADVLEICDKLGCNPSDILGY